MIRDISHIFQDESKYYALEHAAKMLGLEDEKW